MERVAHHLQQAAVARRGNREDFDVFARSAFNRYYYSLFLIVRSTVLLINPKWDAVHSGIPDVLQGSIYDQINKYRKNSLKRQDRETIEICNRALFALKALADLMKNANSVRVLADYNPQISVVDEGDSRFALGATNITSAHGWPERAKSLTREVERAWGLVSGT